MIATTRGFVVSAVARWLCSEGFRNKEVTLIFQKHVIRYVIVDEKRQQTGSVKVKIDLC